MHTRDYYFKIILSHETKTFILTKKTVCITAYSISTYKDLYKVFIYIRVY